MGLDMFLFAKSNNTSQVVPAGEQDFDAKREVAYWRKANQIHSWFVRNVQHGVDECQLSPVTRDQLEELRQTCMQVLSTKDHTLLEPIGGFFFGSTAIDEYYWEDLRTTIDMLDTVLALSEDNEFFYQSSW